LPAITTVTVAVPLDSLLAGFIWVAFGAVLIPVLFLQHRSMARREEASYAEAVAARDATIERAHSIQIELEKVRNRLATVEPAERAHTDEIASLERERERLQAKLSKLARQEARLREHAARSADLEQERQALEDLLDDAVQDLDEKEREIQGLQERLKHASKGTPSRGRARSAEQLAKRMRTLYRNLEIDDRAIEDMARLCAARWAGCRRSSRSSSWASPARAASTTPEASSAPSASSPSAARHPRKQTSST
jgi:predicted  nucleic acid-binding Zn-ribbon protein